MSSKELSNVLDQDIENSVKNNLLQENGNPSWKLSLPHICVATLNSFLYGYHVSVVNEPLESISLNLGFAGNTLAEGLMVSTFLGGGVELLSGLFSVVHSRWDWQLQIILIKCFANDCWSCYKGFNQYSRGLEGMLLGRVLVNGMGLGLPVASLYVTEISPSYVRGTYGGFFSR